MSNALARDLSRLVAERERTAAGVPARFRQRAHLMPPVGWLNDPNGLNQRDGVFHAYFQYATFDAAGGVKMWGHATSADLLTWVYDRCVLFPDEPFDVHGVYSGSALVEEGRTVMFYTGNVKQADLTGDLDYVNAGRESNTVMVETADGSTFGPKRLLMTNADYPSDLTCHVRDPKVWRADAAAGRYLMVQGARRRVDGAARPSSYAGQHGAGAGRDAGEVVVFASNDLVSWRVVNRVSTPARFGFMWECPDHLEFARDGHEGPTRFLSVSPQGLEGGDWERRNIYQSGYFPLSGSIEEACELGAFRLWDAGFDFYAPQTFTAEDGRIILIGWLGMPDAPYGNDPTLAEGWQHCLTLPREVTLADDGGLLQAPVRELEGRRGPLRTATGALRAEGGEALAFDLVVEGIDEAFELTLGGGLTLALRPAGEGMPRRLEMRFADPARASMGCGRTVRWEPVDALRRLRAVGDASSLEVFANDGALCMSTRCYPEERTLAVDAPGAAISLWPLTEVAPSRR